MSVLRFSRSIALYFGLVTVLSAVSSVAEAQLTFYNLAPCRVFDTRTPPPGTPLPASTEKKVTMKGVCGVPSGALTVSINVTMIQPSQQGFLVLWPTGGTYPSVSNVNANANEPAIANGAIVPIAAVVVPDLSVAYGTSNGAGTTHVAIDVTGYFK